MAGIELKVTPEVLKSKSDDILAHIRTVESEWQAITNLVENSRYYWEGEASEVHRKSRADMNDEVEQLIRRMKEHPADLLKMADIYTQAENTAVQRASSLMADVIV